MCGSAGGLRKIVRGGERAGEKPPGLYCMPKKFLTVCSPSITEKIVDRDIKPQSKQTKKLSFYENGHACHVEFLFCGFTGITVYSIKSKLKKARQKNQDVRKAMFNREIVHHSF